MCFVRLESEVGLFSNAVLLFLVFFVFRLLLLTLGSSYLGERQAYKYLM